MQKDYTISGLKEEKITVSAPQTNSNHGTTGTSGISKGLVFRDTSGGVRSVKAACKGSGDKGLFERPSVGVSASGVMSGGGVPDNRLWADKHKPANTSQLLGNNSSINNFKTWLKNWHDVHVTKKLPMPKFSRQNPGGKAVLISGPPGIGKSSAAALVGRELGWLFESSRV